MMIETTDQHPSRDARFPVVEGRKVSVVIERDGSPPQQINADIVDVSRKGMKLSIPVCPSMEGVVVLKLAAPAIDLDMSVDGQICWTRPAPKDAWHLGCTLTPELPEEVLTDLAVNGYVQRRRDPRHLVDLPATMRCEGSQAPASARVLDYSTGGFRLDSSCTATTGGRLLLRFDDEPDSAEMVVAKTMWQVKTATGHQIGCTFVNRDGHQIFQDVLHKHQASPAGTAVAMPHRSRWSWLSLAALVGVLVLRYFLLP